jgi:hypothetical protein
VLLAVHHGLGVSQDILSEADVAEVYILLWISRQFYALATGCSILSVTLFIMRITQTRHHLWILKTTAVMEGVWIAVTFFVLMLACGIEKPWNTRDGCLDLASHSGVPDPRMRGSC